MPNDINATKEPIRLISEKHIRFINALFFISSFQAKVDTGLRSSQINIKGYIYHRFVKQIVKLSQTKTNNWVELYFFKDEDQHDIMKTKLKTKFLK